MTITINGTKREIQAGVTLAQMLGELGLSGRPGIAVAVNEAVVASARLGDHRVEDGDTIEVIQAVSGG
ncbi:MAG: sulfur carrier protein ThiS [Vulcanimicrobiaceae bacterium]